MRSCPETVLLFSNDTPNVLAFRFCLPSIILFRGFDNGEKEEKVSCNAARLWHSILKLRLHNWADNHWFDAGHGVQQVVQDVVFILPY